MLVENPHCVEMIHNPLTDKELRRLSKFIGYGTLHADIWFLGMEEGGGGPDNIHRRLKFGRVEDSAAAHKILGIEEYHWGKKKIQRTWRGMCFIMLGLDGKKITQENIRHYQAESLGRLCGRTLLTELMPIPKPKIDYWKYNNLIPQFASSKEYYSSIKPNRIRYLRRLIKKYNPRVVVCYGKKYWPDYKEIFDDLTFKMKGQFELAQENDIIVIFTHHFTSRAMNGKFGDVVSIIKAHTNKW